MVEGLFILCFGASMWSLMIVLYNYRTAYRLEEVDLNNQSRVIPRVSILVPARNEAKNLAQLLPALEKQDYPKMEILVYNDESTDETVNVIQNHQSIRLLTTAKRPKGWLGKNWACHQLSLFASGEILIFCDADVKPEPKAVSQTIKQMNHHQLDALSVLPRQVLGTWGEKLLIPAILNGLVVRNIPLKQVTSLKTPVLALAAGMWLVFRRKSYEKTGGHQSVKDQIVEDIALARNVKKKGLKLAIFLATELLAVRMYSSFWDAWLGFRKNLGLIFPKWSGYVYWFPIFLLLVELAPWFFLFTDGIVWALPLGVLLMGYLVSERISGHYYGSIWLQPLRTILVASLIWDSFLHHRFGSVYWKDRKVKKLA